MSLSAYNTELCPGRDMDVSIGVPDRFRANIAGETEWITGVLREESDGGFQAGNFK